MAEEKVAASPPTPWDPAWLSRIMTEMKGANLPAIELFAAAQQRNLEAMAAANQVAIEGAQAVVRRHMEMVQRTIAELAQGAEAVARAETPQAKALQQAEAMRQAYEHAITEAREMRDLIQQANSEALDLLRKRFASAIEEVEKAAESLR